MISEGEQRRQVALVSATRILAATIAAGSTPTDDAGARLPAAAAAVGLAERFEQYLSGHYATSQTSPSGKTLCRCGDVHGHEGLA